MTSSILVVEDEEHLAEGIRVNFEAEGWSVDVAGDGEQALALWRSGSYDLIVLDVMLPKLDGHSVCRAIREKGDRVPVLFLTAKNTSEDRIQGLELGADDYLTKPFSPRELVLRVDAILRRAQGDGQPTPSGGRVLRAGDLKVDLSALRVTLDDTELQLTPTEFRLLKTLMERRGRTQSRRQLLEEAWNVDAEVADRIQTRTVDMHVRRLRAKLGSVGDWIETVRGFGYRFRKEES